MFSSHVKFSSYPFTPGFQKNTPVIAAFSMRAGGVSQCPYDSLNLAYHVDDDDASVAENRRLFCAALGIDLDSLVIAQQVHGTNIVVVDESYAGRGAHSHENAIPETDSMITNSHSVALGILTADCVPVLIIDPIRKAIGIAHAGWRGTIGRIAAKTILKMCDVYNTKTANCLVTLGPSIGACCYTVGADLISQFREAFGSEVCTETNKLDLYRAVEKQLVDIGVEKSNITSDKLCTACNVNLLYSHRAEGGNTGRMMSVIKLI